MPWGSALLRTLLQQGAGCPFEGHKQGQSQLTCAIVWAGLTQRRGGEEMSFLTTLQRPVTGRFMDALNKASL
jgi:hypothetical protein